MLVLYFSGTGNSRFIARQFAQLTGGEIHSIEEPLDFASLLGASRQVTFVYPIYGSCVPLIMRQFVEGHRLSLPGKEIVILCTQALFSGDGARVFTDLLRGIDCAVVYGEHFQMPSNIPNTKLFPMASPAKTELLAKRASARLQKIGENLERGVVVRRGFNFFSKWLGFCAQRAAFSLAEGKLRRDVRINGDCIRCQKCVKLCPMGNLALGADAMIKQQGQCTLCYRCVNQCPRQAITVMTHGRVTRQYAWKD